MLLSVFRVSPATGLVTRSALLISGSRIFGNMRPGQIYSISGIVAAPAATPSVRAPPPLFGPRRRRPRFGGPFPVLPVLATLPSIALLSATAA